MCDMTQKLLIKVSPGILLQPFAMVGTINLPGRAEALARRTSDNQIHFGSSYQGLQIIRRKGGEIFFQDVRHIRKICPKHFDGFRIEIDGREALEASPLQAQGKTSTATKKVDEGKRTFHGKTSVQCHTIDGGLLIEWEAEKAGIPWKFQAVGPNFAT